MSLTIISQLSKAEAFKALHETPGVFVTPNPWDVGSAKMLASLGFAALATTSAGLAFSLGKPDGEAAVTLLETLENARIIAAAVNLPVSADLENGYSEDPEECAKTILRAANSGVVGGSIEDTTGNPADPILSFELSVERIKAAAKAAQGLPFPFTLTARAENLIYGRPDLNDTIRRLQAFAEAGADVLFAPGLRTRDEISAVVKALAPKPVSVLMGTANSNLSVNELADLGVKRISLGSSLVRAAYHGLLSAGREINNSGTFSFASSITSYPDINNLLR